MRPGRRPKPSALAHIGPRSHKKPNEREPQPRRALPECPPHLDDEAQREWNRVALELYQCGLLTIADRAILAMYCQMWSRWRKAEAELRKSGLTMQDPYGKVMAHPLVKIVQDTLHKMTAAAAELGLTPAARTKIQVSPPSGAAPPADPGDPREDEEQLERLIGGEEGAA